MNRLKDELTLLLASGSRLRIARWMLVGYVVGVMAGLFDGVGSTALVSLTGSVFVIMRMRLVSELGFQALNRFVVVQFLGLALALCYGAFLGTGAMRPVEFVVGALPLMFVFALAAQPDDGAYRGTSEERRFKAFWHGPIAATGLGVIAALAAIPLPGAVGVDSLPDQMYSRLTLVAMISLTALAWIFLWYASASAGTYPVTANWVATHGAFGTATAFALSFEMHSQSRIGPQLTFVLLCSAMFVGLLMVVPRVARRYRIAELVC